MTEKKQPAGIQRNLTRYGDQAFSLYLRKAFLSSAGYDPEDLDRLIVGIVDTHSDYNTCHRQMPEMVAAVKRGVLQSGGLPFAFPTISLNEILTAPTTMAFRNLMAMETEEMIRAQPMDAVVLLGGCDKTVPAQIMAALSADIPAIQVVTGPMLTGSWRGERLGACTDCRRLWARYRAGDIGKAEIEEITANLCSTGGTCMVMGTASSMACVTEALGLMLPGGASAPHATGERLKQCVAAGRRSVALAREQMRPGRIVTPEAIHNAATVLMALGGSTNAIIHLTAIARRAGQRLDMEKWNAISSQTPLLVDCKPAGVGYMEDFHNAGGVPVLLKALEPLLHTETVGVSGRPLSDLLSATPPPADWQTTVRSMQNAISLSGAITTLSGTLAPEGAVIKTAAASPALFHHVGPAVVFESPEDAAGRIDDPALAITPGHVLVLRNGGPVGAGMPEAGSLPIPRYLAEQGVRDMVRVSDARMSGTAYGTVVLHCSPEAAVGGPIGLVENGDQVELDLDRRTINLCIDESTLSERKMRFQPPRLPARGWLRIQKEHILQASEGADLDFL